MGKHRLGLFNPFSRLATVALMVTLILAVLNFRDRTKMNHIFQEQQDLLILKKQLTQAGQDLLRARLNESQLINTQKTVFFEGFEQDLDEVESLAQNLSGQFQDDDGSDPLETALIHLDQYRGAVINTRSLQQKMGLGDADGILKQLQASNQKIEADLTQFGNQKLVFELAHMQIYEKDFSSTLDMRLADQLMDQVAELSVAIQEANLSPEIQGPLLNEINVYGALVAAFINRTVELELSIAESTLYYDRIAPELSVSQGSIDQRLAFTAAQLRSQRQISTIQTITVFCGAFSILLLLVILQLQRTRRLAMRLQQLTNGMQTVAAGNFEEIGELPQGNDDVGTLAKTFAAMAQQIRRQIDTIRKAQQKAEIASQAKSGFLANMSHELRTPLNAILGFTQMMLSQPLLTAEQNDNLRIIHQSGEHLLSLINDVLDMSKIESGKFTLQEDTFDIYNLLKTLESMLRFKAESKGIHLILSCAPTVPQFIKTDQQKLRQVLINLVGNGLKFTQAGQVTLTVEVGTPAPDEPFPAEARSNRERSHPQTLRFTISDSGPGIAPGELQQLFESFSQGQQGQLQGGTGLGLAISKGFIQLMGGDIQVRSQLGRGSQFSFDIQVQVVPAMPLPPPHPQRRTIMGLAPAQPDYRILIVENNATSRRLMVKLLTSVGFRVKEATHGGEAIALCQQWYPHLIWMDINMPVMNGADATRKIKQWATGQSPTRWSLATPSPRPTSEPALASASAAPHLDWPEEQSGYRSSGATAPQAVSLPIVIALSANAFEADRQQMLMAGCSDFVSKPIQRSLILRKIADYLGACYIYDDAPTESLPLRRLSMLSGLAEASLSSPVLTPELLRTMPLEWVRRLHQEACLAEQDKITELMNDIVNVNAPLALAIQHLVAQFDYGKIIACTGQVLDHG